MKKNIYKICLLLTFSVFAAANVMAQLALPNYAMGIPKVFQDEEESWTWNRIASDRNWGECSKQFWSVYVDREDVKAFEAPRLNSRVVKTLNFMDKFYVADEQNGYMLLYTEKYSQTNLVISKNAEAIGWVSVDELLLWSTCPRTKSQIYQKAVILKDPEEIQNKKDLQILSPEFSKSPYKMISTKRRAIDLEFYFVFKTVNGAALLLEDNKITTSLTSTKKGWMKKGLYTSWNDRLCFEPNYGEDVEGAQAAIFTSTQEAQEFKSTGEISAYNNPLWKETLGLKRWSPNKVRFPVIDMGGRYIAQVGTISSLGKKSSPSPDPSPDDWEKVLKKINEYKYKLNNTNIVFVMDGTSSMRNYYQPMAKALERVMLQDKIKGANMNFGAVVYRNYADEAEGRLVETKPLTKDYMSVAQWLVSRECRSVGKSHYEAMLYGLETAVDQMKWSKENSNFIILVGDAANALPDAKGKTIESISAKLAEKGINLVVFQANHMNHAAYHDFYFQTQKLILNVLNKITNKKVTRSDFKLSNQTYNYKDTNLYMVVSAGIRFAEIDKHESESNLSNLVEEKIVDFRDQTEKNIEILLNILDGLPQVLDGLPPGDFDEEGIIEYLKNVVGLTQEEIEVIKARGMTLKIKGHTTRVAGNTEVFTTSVFMAKSELTSLIQSLSSVNMEVSDNLRKDLQDALKKLVMSYMGENANADEMSVDEVMATVTGLTSTIGRKVLPNINIRDITNPSRISESEIETFMRSIERDVNRLKKLEEDKSCYFDSNGLRYYYILIEDMPLMAD